jgi:hypothetical protein
VLGPARTAVFVIDSIARPLVLLDANAVRYCFKRDGFTPAQLERLRNAVRKLAQLNLVRFMFTRPVDWELTQVYFEESSAAYAELLGFYTAISGEWVLLPEYERRELELRRGRKLKVPEAYPTRLDIPRFMRERDAIQVQQLHDMQREHKDREAAAEAAKRTALLPFLDKDFPGWRVKFAADATDHWTKVVRGFAKDEMRKLAKKIGLCIAPGSWPPPPNLATFWFGESWYVAKFLCVFIETKKQLSSKKSLKWMPDMIDATHFRDAAYADVLVTHDEAFRTVAARASTGLKVMTFDDLAHLVLSRASSLGI